MLTLDEQIIEDYKNGLSRKEICEKYNVTKSFVAYRLRRDFQEILQRRKAKFATDIEFIELVKKYLPQSNSLNHLCNKLGLKGVEGYYTKIKKIIEDYHLDTSHFGQTKHNCFGFCNSMTDEEYFASNAKRDGRNLLKRLLNHSYKEYKCECCGLNEWRGEKIPIEVHHINGNHFDNRIENLQLLCRNCHALTENYGSKNHKEKTKQRNVLLLQEKMEEQLQKIKKDEEEKQKILEAFKIHKSFSQTSKCFGLSNNGLKKRCIKLDIFDKIKEMQKK
jgi:hypothetical protein